MALFLAVGIACSLIAFLVYHYYSTRSYVTVQAEIIDIQKYYGESNDNNMVLYKKEILRYSYQGNTYTSSRETFRLTLHRIGDIYNVRCDPNNPEKIENQTKVIQSVLVCLMCILFSTIVIIDVRKNSKRRI